MLAHDLLKQDDRAFTPTSSSKSASYFCVLILTKLLRCIGIFFLDILAKSTHIISLLWLLKSISSLILFPIQKPLTSGKTIRKPLFIRICRLSIVNCIVEALWFYGITFCGPLRSVLVFELSPSLLLIAVASFFKGSSTPAKSRGFMLLIVGFVSLMLMDRDQTISDSHADAHGHHSGFHYLRHVIDLFGFGDHQGGVVILFLALLLRIGYDSSFRHLAVEIGGPKRLYALVTAFSAIILIPLAVLAMVFGTSSQFSMSSTEFVPLLFVTAGFVMVLDFYAESICFQHVADPVLASARWSPITMFTCALGLAYMWYSSQNKAEHAITGGVFVTVVSFILASISLTSATTKHRGGGVYVGISATGLPLFADGEAFLKKTSQSLFVFFKETLRDILANKDSRRIFYFLCLNFSFCGVEFLYGFWTNSLGLISDGFHMLFDCSALVMGLVASVMARWPPSKHFTYGYGRVEVLSGFINALFLCVIAVFILIEALERLFDPPNVNTDKLLFIAISGLLVNLFGMYSFHGGDDGGHGHSHGGHGHSHGGHGHSHGNANMEGVFLHVLADALGSVFVIISTLLIQWFGWRWVDPLCSLILSLLILGSVYPLLMSSMSTLLQDIPDHEELDHHLAEILEVEGVQSFSNVHMWQQKGDMNVASISVQAQGNANGQAIRHKIAAILKTAGAALATVQVEKDYFAHKIQQLCPSYHFGHKVMRGSMMRSEKSHSHGHSHGACDDNHGHSHGGHGHSHNGGANHGHSHH